MEISAKEIVGLVWTGILSMLWWDIRGIRKEREGHKKEIEKDYLKKNDHTLMCENTLLKFQRGVTGEINKATKAIINEIKNNGGRS